MTDGKLHNIFTSENINIIIRVDSRETMPQKHKMTATSAAALLILS